MLGDEPILCTPVGGETGVALRALLGDMSTKGLVACSVAVGSYIHDRRAGDREVIATLPSANLDRHVIDDLISATPACGFGSPVVVICGSNLDANIEPTIYESVCHNLRAGASRLLICPVTICGLRWAEASRC